MESKEPVYSEVINIRVTMEEYEALLRLSHRERRDFRRQAAIIISQKLEDLGLLPLPPRDDPILKKLYD